MAHHDLKTDPDVFQAVVQGLKTYEIRKDDRGFSVGDVLCLRETTHTGEEMRNGAPLEYTGKSAIATVSHVLRGPIYGLAEGWVILSISFGQEARLAAENADLRARMEAAERDDDMTTAYMVGREAGKDATKAELQRVRAEVKRLREVELLAKDYRRAWKAFQTVPALHEETGSIPWAEVDKAYGAAVAARDELLAVLGKEAAE